MSRLFKNIKKINNVHMPLMRVGLIVLFLLISVFYLTGCRDEYEEQININNYVQITTDGYDGYGSMLFSINYDALFEEHLSSEATKTELLDLAENFEPFIAACDEQGMLANGQTIEVVWQKNKGVIVVLERLLQKRFVANKFTCNVSGLQEVIFCDPFENLEVETNGTLDGRGSLEFCIRYARKGKEDIVIPVEHDGRDGKLKNGDTVTLSIPDNFSLEELARETGVEATRSTIQYQINCLGVKAVGEEIFEKIDNKTKANLSHVIEEWVIAGLNDTNIMMPEQRVYRNVGYIYYTDPVATDTSDEQSSGMFFAVYEIHDKYVPGSYYVFIGISGEFTIDHQRLYCNGEILPKSFINYEKTKAYFHNFLLELFSLISQNATNFNNNNKSVSAIYWK